MVTGMLQLMLKENHIMRTRILAASTLATVVISGLAFAQTPKTEEDHAAHHPAGSAPVVSTSASGAVPSLEAFNQQMKAMQDMHQKMQAAKTSAERAKLMDEHMKLTQSGMAMMGQMREGTAGMAGMSGMGSPTSGGTGMMGSDAQGGGRQTSEGNSEGMSGMGGMMNMHMQMERRMAMMEQLMQMMVDREAARSGK